MCPQQPKSLTRRMRRTDSVDSAILDDPTDIAGAEDEPAVELHLAFYRDDYMLVYEGNGEPTFARANFLRGHDGSVEWLRYGGRLYRHQGVKKGRRRRGSDPYLQLPAAKFAKDRRFVGCAIPDQAATLLVVPRFATDGRRSDKGDPMDAHLIAYEPDAEQGKALRFFEDLATVKASAPSRWGAGRCRR